MSAIEVAEEVQTTQASKFSDDVIFVDDLLDGFVGPVEGVSDFVDPLISFDAFIGICLMF